MFSLRHLGFNAAADASGEPNSSGNSSFEATESDATAVARIEALSQAVVDDPSELNQALRDMCAYLGTPYHDKVDALLGNMIAGHASRMLSTLWTVLLQRLRESSSIRAQIAIIHHFSNIADRISIPQRTNAFRVFAKEVMGLCSSAEVVVNHRFSTSFRRTLEALGVYADEELSRALLEKAITNLAVWQRPELRRAAAFIAVQLVGCTRFCGTFVDLYEEVERTCPKDYGCLATVLDTCCPLALAQAKRLCKVPESYFVVSFLEVKVESLLVALFAPVVAAGLLDTEGASAGGAPENNLPPRGGSEHLAIPIVVSCFEKIVAVDPQWVEPNGSRGLSSADNLAKWAIVFLEDKNVRKILLRPLLSFLRTLHRSTHIIQSAEVVWGLTEQDDPLVRSEAFATLSIFLREMPMGEAEKWARRAQQAYITWMAERCTLTVGGVLFFLRAACGRLGATAFTSRLVRQIIRSHLDLSNPVNSVSAIQVQMLALMEAVEATMPGMISYVLSSVRSSDAKVREKAIDLLEHLVCCDYLYEESTSYIDVGVVSAKKRDEGSVYPETGAKFLRPQGGSRSQPIVLDLVEFSDPSLRGVDFFEGSQCHNAEKREPAPDTAAQGGAQQLAAPVKNFSWPKFIKNIHAILNFFHFRLRSILRESEKEEANLISTSCEAILAIGRRVTEDWLPLGEGYEASLLPDIFYDIIQSLMDIVLSGKFIPADTYSMILATAAVCCRLCSCRRNFDIHFHKLIFNVVWNILHRCCIAIDPNVAPRLIREANRYLCEMSLHSALERVIAALAHTGMTNVSNIRETGFYTFVERTMDFLVALTTFGRHSSVFVAQMRALYRHVLVCLDILAGTHAVSALHACKQLMIVLFLDHGIEPSDPSAQYQLAAGVTTLMCARYISASISTLTRSLSFDLVVVGEQLFNLIEAFIRLDTSTGDTRCYVAVDEHFQLFRRMVSIAMDDTYYTAARGSAVVEPVTRCIARLYYSPHFSAALKLCDVSGLERIADVIRRAQEGLRCDTFWACESLIRRTVQYVKFRGGSSALPAQSIEAGANAGDSMARALEAIVEALLTIDTRDVDQCLDLLGHLCHIIDCAVAQGESMIVSQISQLAADRLVGGGTTTPPRLLAAAFVCPEKYLASAVDGVLALLGEKPYMESDDSDDVTFLFYSELLLLLIAEQGANEEAMLLDECCPERAPILEISVCRLLELSPASQYVLSRLIRSYRWGWAAGPTWSGVSAILGSVAVESELRLALHEAAASSSLEVSESVLKSPHFWKDAVVVYPLVVPITSGSKEQGGISLIDPKTDPFSLLCVAELKIAVKVAQKNGSWSSLSSLMASAATATVDSVSITAGAGSRTHHLPTPSPVNLLDALVQLPLSQHVLCALPSQLQVQALRSFAQFTASFTVASLQQTNTLLRHMISLHCGKVAAAPSDRESRCCLAPSRSTALANLDDTQNCAQCLIELVRSLIRNEASVLSLQLADICALVSLLVRALRQMDPSTDTSLSLRYSCMYLLVLVAPDRENLWYPVIEGKIGDGRAAGERSDKLSMEQRMIDMLQRPILEILCLCVEIDIGTCHDVAQYVLSIFLRSSGLSAGINESILWLVVKCCTRSVWLAVLQESLCPANELACIKFLCKMTQTVGISAQLMLEMHARYTPLLLTFGTQSRELDADEQRIVLWLITALLLNISTTEERYTKPKPHMSLVDSIPMYNDFPLSHMSSDAAIRIRSVCDNRFFPLAMRIGIVPSERHWNSHIRGHLLPVCGRQTVTKAAISSMITSLLHLYTQVVSRVFNNIDSYSPQHATEVFFSLGTLAAGNAALLRHSLAFDGTISENILQSLYGWYRRHAAPTLTGIDCKHSVVGRSAGLLPELNTSLEFTDTFSVVMCATTISSLFNKGDEAGRDAVDVGCILEKMLSLDLFSYQAALNAFIVMSGSSTRKELYHVTSTFARRIIQDLTLFGRGALSMGFSLLQMLRCACSIVSSLPDESVTMKLCEAVWNVVIVHGAGGRRAQYYAHFMIQCVLNMSTGNQAQWNVLCALLSTTPRPLSAAGKQQPLPHYGSASVPHRESSADAKIQQAMPSFTAREMGRLTRAPQKQPILVAIRQTSVTALCGGYPGLLAAPRSSSTVNLQGLLNATPKILNMCTTASLILRSKSIATQQRDIDRNRVQVLDLFRTIEAEQTAVDHCQLFIMEELMSDILEPSVALFTVLNAQLERRTFLALIAYEFRKQVERAMLRPNAAASNSSWKEPVGLLFEACARSGSSDPTPWCIWWALCNVVNIMLATFSSYLAQAAAVALVEPCCEPLQKEVCRELVLYLGRLQSRDQREEMVLFCEKLQGSCAQPVPPLSGGSDPLAQQVADSPCIEVISWIRGIHDR